MQGRYDLPKNDTWLATFLFSSSIHYDLKKTSWRVFDVGMQFLNDVFWCQQRLADVGMQFLKDDFDVSKDLLMLTCNFERTVCMCICICFLSNIYIDISRSRDGQVCIFERTWWMEPANGHAPQDVWLVSPFGLKAEQVCMFQPSSCCFAPCYTCTCVWPKGGSTGKGLERRAAGQIAWRPRVLPQCVFADGFECDVWIANLKGSCSNHRTFLCEPKFEDIYSHICEQSSKVVETMHAHPIYIYISGFLRNLRTFGNRIQFLKYIFVVYIFLYIYRWIYI